MKKIVLLAAILTFTTLCFGQLLTWTPDFPKDNDNITITLDATKGNQGLNNYSDPNNIYVHIGVTTNLSNNGGRQWLYVNGSTGGTYGSATPALKATSLGNNKYQYTITNIRSFFGVPAGETINKIGILFRDANANPDLVKKAANTDNSDMFIPLSDNNIAVKFTSPFYQPLFVPAPEPITKTTGDNIIITAITNKSAALKLKLNGNDIQTQSNATSITATPVLTVAGNNTVIAEAVDGAITSTATFQFFVSNPVTTAPLPPGVRDGINYAAGNTEATLVLYAPNKGRVCIIGEFAGSNWAEQSQYQMTKTPDGNYWWKTITGLTPGTEYAFQYLVDGTLKIAEPYTEKILDPGNDNQITADVYPGLRTYPAGQTGIVSILQTAPAQYTWRDAAFTRPDKKNLLIYEVLVRDFTDAHRWQTMIDTLTYIQRLGVNAIELMPVSEFENNDSWGYNPSFSFAPDKYYGTKNKLKEFIDSCHSKKIAVIMDVVPNHVYNQSPLAQLYWNSGQNRPASDNPWLNPVQPHAFGFGNDFNHESAATKYYWKRVLDFWLREYKMDGYRLDFTKGLTQKPSADDGQFSAYDQSRIDILRTYADTVWKYFPSAYMILEHLATATEEQALQNMGFLMWGGARENKAYTEATMGYNANSNFSSIVYSSNERGFTNPHLVGYMESHDEERMMYKNLTYGNSTNAAYNVKMDSIALRRMEAAASLFITIPGPKMIWEFGERGYDKSIFACVDNSIPQPYEINQTCKLDRKEPRWQYMQDAKRKRLVDVYAALLKLRTTQTALFNSTNFSYSLINAVKYFTISSPDLSAMIVANFDVVGLNATLTFPGSGTWYDYLTGETITATGSAQVLALQPGEYHVYLNKNITNVITTPVFTINRPSDVLNALIFPNPVAGNSYVEMENPETGKVEMRMMTLEGKQLAIVYTGTLSKGKHVLPFKKTQGLPAGLYLLRIQAKNKVQTLKVVIQ